MFSLLFHGGDLLAQDGRTSEPYMVEIRRHVANLTPKWPQNMKAIQVV